MKNTANKKSSNQQKRRSPKLTNNAALTELLDDLVAPAEYRLSDTEIGRAAVKGLSAEFNKLASEMLEDVGKSASFSCCGDAAPTVARNFRRLSARLARLAFHIEEAGVDLHIPSILEAKWLLEQYHERLPMIMEKQLEGAIHWLPIGCVPGEV